MLAMGDNGHSAERSQPNGLRAAKAKDAASFPRATPNGAEEQREEKVSTATSIDFSDRKITEAPTKTTDQKTTAEDKIPEGHQQPNDNTDLQFASSNCPLRRSTRVSALNAKKQTQQNERTESERSVESPIKSNEDDELEMVQEHRTDGDAAAVSSGMEVDEHTSALSQQHRVSSLKRKLKRKLDDGQQLDQYDCKFGIRLDTEGDVVMMSDESEISSLNEADVAELRERYENTRRQEMPKEVMAQRELQIRELESILRLEEAKLMMLKKLQQSQQKSAQKTQQQSQQQTQQENVRRLAPGVVQNSTGQAYKPKVAVVNPSQHQTGNSNKTNGTTQQHGKKGASKAEASVLQNGAGLGAALGGVVNSGATIQLASLPPQHQQVIQQLYTRLSQNPQQLAQMIKTLPHSTGQALTELLRQYAVAQASNVQPTGSGQIQSSTAAASAKFAQQLQSSVSSQAIAQAQVEAAHKQARELTQQKIASARQQLRKELDVMIMKLPAPKAPPPDLQFIPNGNQPDFCYLLGLDLTVQRVLKDKTMFRKADFPPYQCEECETDFTPSWKAICGEQEDYHLYCERCIRQAQKRKVRQDYSALLKRAFQQVQEREKEFERQVLAGKFNVEPVLPTQPTIGQTQQQTTTTPTGNVQMKQQHNMQTAVSNQSTSTPKGVPSSSAASLQQFNQQHNSSAALNLSKSGAASAGAIANAMPTVANTAKGQNLSSAQSTKSASTKRTSSVATTASSSSSAAMANSLAALAQNPQLQQQFAAMASISNPLFRQVLSNPIFAAAMTNNPMQIYAALAATQQQRTQQQQNAQNPAANASGTAAGNAMAALIQAVQQSVHQQQSRTNVSSTAVTSNSSGSSSSVNPPAVSSSSSANSIAQQMAMAAFASSPMLALQSQLSQMGAGGAANANMLLNHFNNNPQLLRQFQQMYLAQQQMKAGTGGGKK